MFNKKKLRKETLVELAKRMPVLNEKKQVAFVGGGNGTRENPFSLSEYMDLGDLFQTGWVDFPDSISYMTCPYGEYYSSSGLDVTSGCDYESGLFGDSGSYGGSGSENNFPLSPFETINELFNQLPNIIKTSLSDVNILYDPTLSSPGQYLSNLNVIYLKDLNYDVLYGECIHAIQEKENYCGNNHTAREFQEHIIRDIMSIYRNIEEGVSFGYVTTSDNNYERWINNCINENGVNINSFLGGVNEYISHFLEYKSNVPQYQGGIPSDYNFNWVEMFQAMGIPIY